MKRPFICLEGVDFVGKTEVGTMIAQKLDLRYYKSPGGVFGKVRNAVDDGIDPLTRFFFYRAATQYDSEQIAEMLKTSGVVCDRYIYSTIAMHAAMDPKTLEFQVNGGIIMPSITFVLTAREEVRMARMLRRKGIDVTEQNRKLQNDADRIFRALCPRIIDTSDNTVEYTAELVINILEKEGLVTTYATT